MITDGEGAVSARGGCLCEAVRFEVRGELGDVVNCHCSKCRRFTGNFGAFTATARENLVITRDDGLKWYRSTKDETPDVYRGFCKECGSTLFWDPRSKPYISIAAGSLDSPTGLSTTRHIWLSQKGDFYTIADDLPQHDEGFGRVV